MQKPITKIIFRRKGLRIAVTLEKYVKLRSTVYEYMIEQDKPISLLDIQEHIVSHHEGKFTKKMLHQFYLSRLLDELKLDGKITLADEYLYTEKGYFIKREKELSSLFEVCRVKRLLKQPDTGNGVECVVSKIECA